jgi:hypothetical protein
MVTLLEILPLVGLSAIIGAGVSAVFNYIFNLKASKKQSQIKLIEQKLALYSYVNFQLDKMRFMGDALKAKTGTDTPNDVFAYLQSEGKDIFSEITERFNDEYYLFKQDFLKDWIYVSTHISDESCIERLPILRQKLVEQYNNVIIPTYYRLTGNKIGKLS